MSRGCSSRTGCSRRTGVTCTPGRSENCWTDGPPIVGSSWPATARIASWTLSASSRRRFCRQSHWLSASIAANDGLVPHALPVDRAGDDQAVQRLERAARLEKRRASQSSSSGCDGSAAHPAEIVGCRDQAAAEMLVPDAVDDRPPGERVPGVGDPASQGRAAGRFVVVERDRKIAPAGRRRSSGSRARPACRAGGCRHA